MPIAHIGPIRAEVRRTVSRTFPIYSPRFLRNEMPGFPVFGRYPGIPGKNMRLNRFDGYLDGRWIQDHNEAVSLYSWPGLVKGSFPAILWVSMAKQDRILFKFNGQKAIEGILWLSHRDPGHVDVYKIVKAFFFGDLYHLNNYGRPIAGDHYVAMKYGPVPSDTYNLISRDRLTVAEYPEEFFELKNNFVIGKREPNLELLSESDIEALTVGWEKVKDLNFQQVLRLAHDHPAYEKAWNNRRTDSDNINFSDLIEDKAKAEHIREIANTLAI